jgi:hypothetical protein
MDERARELSYHARPRLAPVLAGLRQAVHGGTVRESEGARRFLGWSQGGHWMLDTGAPRIRPGQTPNGGA